MTERPILFSGSMVRAILSGAKSQTRRAIKLPHMNPLGQWEATTFGGPDGGRTRDGKTVPLRTAIWHTRTGDGIAARWALGDRLWVREAWRTSKVADELKPSLLVGGGYSPVWYEAQAEVPFHPSEFGKLRPSMFMPRWASRITLEITGVRVDRLQDISEADAIAEGIRETDDGYYSLYNQRDTDSTYSPRASYRALWESINGPNSWDANPWVWAIEFKRIYQGLK